MSTDDPDPSDLPPAVRETLDSLGGALGDIAELDKEQLNETIGLLETLGHDQAAGILRSRREVLKGAGAATGLGIAGLAGATATGGARAQSDTQTGTIGNGNQDADLQDVSAQSVNTEQVEYALNNTGFSNRLSDRPLVSTQDRTITVGTDTNSIQEALNQIPLLLRHQWDIQIPDGTYDEHLLVPPFILADTAGQSLAAGTNEGASQNVWIQGNVSTPSNVKVNSIAVTGTNGAIAPIIEGMQLTGSMVGDDDSAAVTAYGCQNVSFRHLDFTGNPSTVGILAYSSTVTVREGVNFGADDLTYGMKTKHNAMLHVDGGPSNTPVTGSVTDNLIYNKGGSVATYEEIDATAGGALVRNFEGFVDADAAIRVSASTEQTIPSGVDERLQFDTTTQTAGLLYDTGDNYDTANYEFTAPIDGRYLISASVEFLNVSQGTSLQLRTAFDDGDTTGFVSQGRKGAVLPNEIVQVSDAFNLDAGDKIWWTAKHDEGTDVDVNTDFKPHSRGVVQLLNAHNPGHE